MYVINRSVSRVLTAIACATAEFVTLTPALARESGYSDTSKGCERLHFDDGARIWRCPGPGGYAAVFSDEGNVFEVEYGKRGHEKNLGGLQWQGGPNAVGPKIEWRVKSGEPYAAILRIGSINADGRAVVHLLVARISAGGGCRMAMIDARRPDANLRARLIADARALWFGCRKY